MADLAPLLERITGLLKNRSADPGKPLVTEMEDTLTDGDARAQGLRRPSPRRRCRARRAAQPARRPPEAPRSRPRRRLARSEGLGLRSPPRCSLDDSAADGVDRRLNAVLDLQLHEDVRDVVLDRLRADEELAGDLGVVLAVRDQLQYLELAVGELGADRLGGVHILGLRAEPLQDLGGDLRRDE